MTKHYIRLNSDKNIIKAFSDKFEQAEKDDICMNENGGRHFHLEIFTPENEFKYKYVSKKIVERTNAEINSLANLKKRKIVEIQNNRQTAERIYNSIRRVVAGESFNDIEAEKTSVVNNAGSEAELENIEW